MSIQRYWPTSSHGGMIPLTKGQGYVKGEDHDAEVERLRGERDEARGAHERARKDWRHEKKWHEETRAEVERLRGERDEARLLAFCDKTLDVDIPYTKGLEAEVERLRGLLLELSDGEERGAEPALQDAGRDR